MTTRRLRERITAALADRYAIGEELGHGGTSVVFRAMDIRHRREVAVKVLYPEVTAVLGRERFLREIEIVASLVHPHVVPLYDSGEADGLLFHVSPCLTGESLRARLDRERLLPLADALRIGAELLDSLAHAHRHGIVHRDVKPGNIFLTGRHALLADFGVARALERSGGTRLTETGIVVGTPAYMSPEQASGEPLDHRSDLYSAACTICEMLSGEAPFAARTPQAAISRRLTEDPCSIRRMRPTVPEHVDAALSRALARLPADRFQSAEEFGAALAHAEAASVGADPPAGAAAVAPRSKRLSFWEEMRRRKVWSAAVIYGSIWVFVIGLTANLKELLKLSEPTWELLARAVFGIGVAGLPVTLALAWAFEVGSERKLRRTGAWKTAGLGLSPSWPLLSRGAVLALTVVLAMVVIWLLVLRPFLALAG